MAGFVTPEQPGLSDVTFPLGADRAEPPAAETPAPPRRERRARAKNTGTTAARTTQPKTARARKPRATTTTPTTSTPSAAPRTAGGDAHGVDVLKGMLGAFVPIRMFEMRDWADEALQAKAAAGSEAVAHHGDDLMFGGKHCASTFTALLDGLSAAALLVGVVDWLELHFCAVKHEHCPSRGPITTRAPGPWAAAARPVADPMPDPDAA